MRQVPTSGSGSDRFGLGALFLVLGMVGVAGVVLFPMFYFNQTKDISSALRITALLARAPLVLTWFGAWHDAWRGRGWVHGVVAIVLVGTAASCLGTGEAMWNSFPFTILSQWVTGGTETLATVHPAAYLLTQLVVAGCLVGGVVQAPRRPWLGPGLVPFAVALSLASGVYVIGRPEEVVVRRDPLPSLTLEGRCVGVWRGRWYADATSWAPWPLPLTGSPPRVMERTVTEGTCRWVTEVRCPTGIPTGFVAAALKTEHPKLDQIGQTVDSLGGFTIWTTEWVSQDPTCPKTDASLGIDRAPQASSWKCGHATW